MKQVYPDTVYTPEEDSRLLLKNTLMNIPDKKITFCEVGVGSGFVIKEIAKKYPSNTYYGTDINPQAIKITTEKLTQLKCNFNICHTDLFSNLGQKFDFIVFNTPYLPLESKDKFSELKDIDKAIYGGKKGYEVIIRFLNSLLNHLNSSGTCLMICSTLSKIEIIEKEMNKLYLNFKIIDQENSFFEKILCYKIQLDDKLNFIQRYNLKEVKFLSKGKHSTVFEGKIEQKKIIVKLGLDEHIQTEVFFSKKLENKPYCSKLLFYSDYYIIKEKIEGITIEKFLKREMDKTKVIFVLNRCLEICNDLDRMGITKKEMTNPYKHIFIDEKLKIGMIDFERAIFSEKPKNTSQFLQYIVRNIPLLKQKEIQISKEKISLISKDIKVNKIKVSLNNILI